MSGNSPYNEYEYRDPYNESVYSNTSYTTDSYGTAAEQADSKEIVKKSFLYMMIALLISGGVAYATAITPNARNLLLSNGVITICFILEIVAMVMAHSFMKKGSVAGTAVSLIAYSAITGFTLSVLFLAYNPAVITKAFVASALMFGLMAIYGMITDKDLSSIGSIGMMALVGIIIMSIVNMIMRSPGLDWLISAVTVVVFVGLTAYDTQKIKKSGYYAKVTNANTNTIAMMGALELYLDFLNIFLSLVRLFGRNSD